MTLKERKETSSKREAISGAEAIILIDENKIIKKRIKKSYRITEIDTNLRSSRTKQEYKILQKLGRIINVPKVYSINDDEIEMELIEGKQIKKVLDKNPEIAKKIGEIVAKMHDNGIIHGDLTTSNMILKNEQIYLIDFGLSFSSNRIEDKAVDIHLFKQALNSKHYTVADIAYKNFLLGYKPVNRKQILERLKQVESRGRYKDKH